MELELFWHKYKFYPYEYELGLKEVESLLKPKTIIQKNHSITVDSKFNHDHAERLVYFSKIKEKNICYPTIQSKLETVNGNGKNRQSTRYSVHGIHEYKGKFNPQIVKAILNILNVKKSHLVLDPFCGSGTSLIECSHYGIPSIGFDINPFAVYVANAKLRALFANTELLRNQLNEILKYFKKKNGLTNNQILDERMIYLNKWFSSKILTKIEYLRTIIILKSNENSQIFLTIASNILRDYSLQDPNDLRIRRRTSSLPEMPFIDEFKKKAEQFIFKLENSQSILKDFLKAGQALIGDSKKLEFNIYESFKNKFNCAITSPPYATALPYIDTQRLSLIWLNLIPAKQILNLESTLIGSREFRGQLKQTILRDFISNKMAIPNEQHKYCQMLNKKISLNDGFRRKAVPMLLYRYFSDMTEAFKSIKGLVKKKAAFALVVGTNHTILGGERINIDTPRHLIDIACCNGWELDEKINLQTYQRYGYNMNNSVNSESLIILRSL